MHENGQGIRDPRAETVQEPAGNGKKRYALHVGGTTPESANRLATLSTFKKSEVLRPPNNQTLPRVLTPRAQRRTNVL